MKRLATIVVLGGCQLAREHGSLKSGEKLSVDCIGRDVKVSSSPMNMSVGTPRRSPSGFYTKENNLLISGGCVTEGKHLGSVELFDGESQSTILLEDVTIPHSCSSFCPVGKECDMLLEVGGYDGTDCLRNVTILKMDPQSKCVRTTKLPPFISRIKNGCAVALDSLTVLIIGGWDESRTSSAVFRLKFSDDFTSYDSEMCGILPFPVEAHSAIKRGEFVYIFGGYDGLSVTNRVVRYSLVDGSSFLLDCKLKIARENHTCHVIFNDLVVVIGGWDGRKSLSSIELFRILPDPPFLESIPCDAQLIEPRIRPLTLVQPM